MREFTFVKAVEPKIILGLLKDLSFSEKFDYFNTKDDEVKIFFKEDLTSNEEAVLAAAISAAKNPDKEVEEGLPEFPNNSAAVEAGLGNGQFYRSGDFVKVVHSGA